MPQNPSQPKTPAPSQSPVREHTVNGTQPHTCTPPTMLTSLPELLVWVAGHAERHAPVDGDLYACSCGYPGVNPAIRKAMPESKHFQTQKQHAEAVAFLDLLQVLPSDTADRHEDGTRTWLSWPVVAQRLRNDLYDRDQDVDPRMTDLLNWVLDKGHDFFDVANAALLAPERVAELTERPVPEVRRDVQPEPPDVAHATVTTTAKMTAAADIKLR